MISILSLRKIIALIPITFNSCIINPNDETCTLKNRDGNRRRKSNK